MGLCIFCSSPCIDFFFLQTLSCRGIRPGSPLQTLAVTVPCLAQARLTGGCCGRRVPKEWWYQQAVQVISRAGDRR